MRLIPPTCLNGPSFTRLFRSIAAFLVLTLAANSVAFAAPPDPVKVHNKLTERGVGKGVKINEADGTTVTGTLTAIHNDDFEITPAGATPPLTISYSQVSSVHNNGPGMSTGAKIGIIVGCIVIVVVVVFVIVAKHNDLSGLAKGPII
jgi:hypothetical protein